MAAHPRLSYPQPFPMLDALTELHRRTLEKMTHRLEVKRGQRIYLQGDPSDQIFLLTVGVVKLSTCGTEQDSILALLYPGDIFGELAMIDPSPRDHGAQAVADTVVCAFDRDLLQQMIQQSPAVGYQIMQLIGLRLRRLRTRVEGLSRKSAHGRIARVLLDLATDYGVKDENGILISIRLNQGELGHFVGLARETVNIVLQDLKQRGLVEAGRQNIRLKDLDRLRAVS